MCIYSMKLLQPQNPYSLGGCSALIYIYSEGQNRSNVC